MDIVAIDIESTGLDVQNDRIVEIAVLDCQHGRSIHTRVNPGISISEAASRVHGITDADVEDLVGFEHCAAEVQELIDGKVILTYSGRSFDTLMLDAELRRAGQPGIDLVTVQEIDLYRVWTEAEPRSLGGAVLRFLGHEHEGAHGAMADASVLERLALEMGDQFDLMPDTMIEYSKPAWEVDRSGKLRKNDEGEICWNFGRNRGERVKDHEGLIFWVLERDFPADTKAALEGILGEMEAEREEQDRTEGDAQ